MSFLSLLVSSAKNWQEAEILLRDDLTNTYTRLLDVLGALDVLQGFTKHARQDSNLQPLVPKTSDAVPESEAPQEVTASDTNVCTTICTSVPDEGQKSLEDLVQFLRAQLSPEQILWLVKALGSE